MKSNAEIILDNSKQFLAHNTNVSSGKTLN